MINRFMVYLLIGWVLGPMGLRVYVFGDGSSVIIQDAAREGKKSIANGARALGSDAGRICCPKKRIFSYAVQRLIGLLRLGK